MTQASRPDRRPAVPSRLLYLTEPARAAVDFGLLAAAAPLLPALPRGDGHPVLVLPGLGSGDGSTLPLRAILRRLGYRTYGWGQGRNIGPTTPALTGMRARLDELAQRFTAPVSLIGWSLGGIYARQLAARRPAAVRQVITLGAPVGLARAKPAGPAAAPDLSRFPPWPHWKEWAHWFTQWQTGARRLPLDAGGDPLPTVPVTAICSRLDGIVGWRICRTAATPGTENIVVATSHLGFAHNPAVVFAVADRLAQPAGQWSPFHPPALLRAVYRSD